MKTEITPTPFQIGNKVIFSVSEDYLKCRGQGEILWTSPTGGIVRIRFTQLDEETRRSLDEFFHLAELRELLSQFRELIEKNLRTLVENGERQDLLSELQRHHDQLQEMVARRTSELVKSKEMLEERVKFEDLVSNLSASFVNIPPDRVDGEIALALDQICRFFKADYCALVEVLADRRQAHYVNLNLQEERQRELLNVDITSGYPWAYHQLVEQGEPVIFSSLEVLPPEARVDRTAFEKEGVQAGLMLPLRIGGQVTHLIGLGSLRNGHEWPVAHIRRLRVLGEVFANALIHKRTQEALLKSERGLAEVSADQIQLGMALEAADMVMWEWDIPTRSIRYSDNIRTIVRGAAVGPYCSLDSLMPEIHPEDREALAEALDQTRKQGTPFECEYRAHMLDGTYRWILAKGKRVVMEGSKPVRVLGLSMDITERKRKEEELKKTFELLSREIEERKQANQALHEAGFRYKTVADFTYSWEYWLGPDGNLYYMSPSCERVSGYPRDQFLGDPDLLRKIILPEDQEIWKEHNKEAWNNPKPLNLEFRMQRKDGETRWIEHVCQPVRDSRGKFMGVRASNRDITDRLRAEKELQRHREELEHASRLATVGELAASLTHELNQPLSATLTNAQVAKRFLSREKPDLNRVRVLLDDIIEGNKRISQLIQRIRKFSKKEKVPYDRLNINEVIQEVISLFYGDLQLEKPTIITVFTPNLPRVMGDRIQLQEVFLNLIMNGLDAMTNMEPEERKLVIQTETKDEETVRVGVQDFGVGLSKDILHQLFEPFFTTKPEGLGMGLGISKSIIEAHGGRLWAENNPHSGATFWFSLPIEHGENS